jgi:hypothetical protein
MFPRIKLTASRCLAVPFLLVLASCGSAPVAQDAPENKYERQVVRRPGDSAEDTKVYVVLNHKKCWVIHAEWLGAHGYKWPDDVKTIPAAELDRIPLGQPIE